jgi:basic membrane protein A
MTKAQVRRRIGLFALFALTFLALLPFLVAVSAQEKGKVAVILPGPISDRGWNYSGHQGLKKAAEARGLTFAYAENVGVADAQAALRDFAEKGFSPIFAHGFQFGDAALITAKAYPKTYFAVIHGGVQNGMNLASFPTAIEEGGFLAGVLAAQWTKTKKVAAIGGLKIPPIHNAMLGFIEGVKYADPNVKVVSVWTGSFTDVALAKETALSTINQGVDVIFMEANESNVGIISATEEKKVFAIGYAMDQSELGPNSVLTSTLIHFPISYGAVIDSVRQGTFDGKSRKMGVADKVIELAPFHRFEERIPATVKARLDEARTLLIQGKVSALPKK